MKTFIVAQTETSNGVITKGLLYTKAPKRQGEDATAPQMYSIALQEAKGRIRTLGNQRVTQRKRAYLRATEAERDGLFQELGLADSNGVAIQHQDKVSPAAWSNHQAKGYLAYELISTETPEPQYTGQLPAGNAERRKVYIDKDDKAIFRSTKANVILGYWVVASDGTSKLYDSSEQMSTYEEAYLQELSDLEPTTQALQAAMSVNKLNEGSKLIKFTEGNQGEIIPMPQDVLSIVKSRKMTNEEYEARKSTNLSLGRTAPAAQAPAETAAAPAPAKTVKATAPVGELEAVVE